MELLASRTDLQKRARSFLRSNSKLTQVLMKRMLLDMSVFLHREFTNNRPSIEDQSEQWSNSTEPRAMVQLRAD